MRYARGCTKNIFGGSIKTLDTVTGNGDNESSKRNKESEMARREVTKDEIFKAIGPLNVHPRPTGEWPYTSHFQTPSGEIRGTIEHYLPEGSALPKSRYWLPT